MLETIGFAVIAMLAFGVNDIIFKRASQKGATAHNIMMTLSLSMFPPLALYGLLSEALVPHPAALWGSLGAAFTYVAFYNFSRALQAGAVSVAVPVFRLFFVGTAILAIVFLNEPLTAWKVLGLVVAVLAVWLLLATSATTKAEISREALARILLAALIGGVPFFFFKLGLVHGASTASVLFCQSFALALISTVASVLIDKKFYAPRVAVQHGIAFGLIQAFGFAILLEGMVRGEASILVPISQLSFLVSAVAGVVLWKEHVTERKLIGIGAAVAAVLTLGVAAK